MFIHRLTQVLVVATLALVAWGGTVTSTNSGLACGDHWPTCFEVRRAEAGEAVRATFMPRMEGGVLLEHGHRLLAATVGLGAIALVFLAYRRRPIDRSVRRTAVVALSLVVAQGLLGAVTVWLRLPAAITTSHLAFSMAFLGSLVLLAFQTRPAPVAPPEPPTRTVQRWTAAAAAVVFVQLVLGAVVRHTGSAPVCTAQFLMCNGRWIPVTTEQWIQILHRGWALVVLAVLVVASLRARRVPGARPFAYGALALVVVQITLGILTVITGIRPFWATTHLLVGGLLWTDVLSMLLVVAPVGASARPALAPEPRRAPIAQGVPA